MNEFSKEERPVYVVPDKATVAEELTVKSQFKKGIIIFILMLVPSIALSWDGAVTGKIYVIDVTGGENYGFRISLDNGSKEMCGNSHKWAYINESHSNYSTYVSVLLTAKVAEKSVTVYSNQKGSNNYCEIGYIRMK